MALPDPGGKRTLGSDKVHLESIHPEIVFPIRTVSGEILPVQITDQDPNTVLTVMDAHELASFGESDTYTVVSKFGRNSDIAINTTEQIWTPSVDRVWLSAGVTFEAISDDGDDDDGGDGAQIITVQGLDTNFDFAETSLTMNGASATLPSSIDMIRFNRAFVNQIGIYGGSNIGNITIRTVSAGATQAHIVAEQGQTEQTHYSLARNKVAILHSHYVSAAATRVVNASIYWRPGIDDVSAPFVQAKRKIWGLTGLSGAHSHHYEAHPFLVGPCDIWWEAESSANGTEVEAGFDLMYKDA